jgi:hypothetical protein
VGFRRIIKLFKSYLTERKQYIKSGRKRNATKSLSSISVIQRSVVGRHLFLIFIDDIFNLVIKGIMMLFADDLTIVFSDKDINKLNTKVNNAMNELLVFSQK